MSIPFKFRYVPLAAFCVAALAAAQPTLAGGFHAVGARRTVGGYATGHVRAARGPDGRQGYRAGNTQHFDDGSATHESRAGYSGPNLRAQGDRSTTRAADGTITHQAERSVTGADGGSYSGQRSYTRNPDGSAQASFQRSGQGAAGGSFQTSGSATRNADGTYLSSRQATASGARGSYAGDTTRGNGTVTHDSTIVGVNGNSYQGQTTYTRGQGITHSGSCKDAQGNPIQC